MGFEFISRTCKLSVWKKCFTAAYLERIKNLLRAEAHGLRSTTKQNCPVTRCLLSLTFVLFFSFSFFLLFWPSFFPTLFMPLLYAGNTYTDDVERQDLVEEYEPPSCTFTYQRRRRTLFILLVITCVTCVYLSYYISAKGEMPCSNYIFWIPYCDREEYLVLSSNVSTREQVTTQ